MRDSSRTAASGLLVTLASIFVLLGQLQTRIGERIVPEVSPWWLTALAAAVFVLVPASRLPLAPARFAVGLALLGALAAPLSSRWRDVVLADSLPARAYRASRDSEPTSVWLDRLHLEERRYLNRLAGRRRDVVLEIEGFVWVPSRGSYGFDLSCDDRCSLDIGRRRLLEDVGAASLEVELEEGIYPIALRYEQEVGPASFEVRWDRPAFVELLPLQNFLGASRSEARARREAGEPWWLLGWTVLWIGASSLLLVRAGESKRAWWVDLVASYRRSDSREPVWLVRSAPWLFAGCVFWTLGALVRWLRPSLLASADEWWGNVPMRLGLAVERIEAYPAFLFLLGLLCLAVGLVFRYVTGAGLSVPRPRRLLLVGTAVVLLWGAYVSQREWVRRDRPCWDSYCEFAESVQTVLRSPGTESMDALRSHLAVNYHANSPLGPLLIAGVGLLGPDIIVSYRLVSAAATLVSLLLVYRIASHHFDLEEGPSLVAVFLFAASGAIHRSFLFPQTDALMMLLFTLVVERLLTLREKFTLGGYLGVVASLSAALLTKLSGLPLIAIAALGIVWPASHESRRDVAASAWLRALRVLPVVLVPLLSVALYMSLFDTVNAFNRELHRMATVDSTFGLHAMATLAVLLPLWIGLVLSWRRPFAANETFVLGTIALYLASLWTSGASGWERFYINVLPIALPLALARLAALPGLGSPPHVTVLCAAYASAHALRMVLHAFNSG